MSRFLKFIPSEESFWLIQYKPKAFFLLTNIANTARRKNGHADGLLIGQCHLQHWTAYKFTEQEYRTAKKILIHLKHILIVETNRTRKKSTTGITTASTLVQLISSTVYDINSESINDRNNDRTTTEQRLNNDKQEERKKEGKEDHHPLTPSADDDDELSSKEEEEEVKEKIEIMPGIFLTQGQLKTCVEIKGSLEKVKEAMEFIQKSPKRMHEIYDWPTALSRWKIKSDVKSRIEENIILAEKLCEQFKDLNQGYSWRCYMYHDDKKDQRGLLFEYSSAYVEAVFISLTDGAFEEKCRNTIKKSLESLEVSS